MLGYTDNYIRVSAAYDPSLANTIASARLGHINGAGHMEIAPLMKPQPAFHSSDHLII